MLERLRSALYRRWMRATGQETHEEQGQRFVDGFTDGVNRANREQAERMEAYITGPACVEVLIVDEDELEAWVEELLEQESEGAE